MALSLSTATRKKTSPLGTTFVVASLFVKGFNFLAAHLHHHQRRGTRNERDNDQRNKQRYPFELQIECRHRTKDDDFWQISIKRLRRVNGRIVRDVGNGSKRQEFLFPRLQRAKSAITTAQ